MIRVKTIEIYTYSIICDKCKRQLSPIMKTINNANNNTYTGTVHNGLNRHLCPNCYIKEQKKINKCFKDIKISEEFIWNQNVWKKQSHRTALLVNVGRWFYFGKNDLCKVKS